MNGRTRAIFAAVLLLLAGVGGGFWYALGTDSSEIEVVRRAPLTEEGVQRILGSEISERTVAFDVQPGQDIAEVLLRVFRDGGNSPVTIQINDAGPTERALAYSGTLGGGLAQLLSANGLVLWRDERGVVRIATEQAAP